MRLRGRILLSVRPAELPHYSDFMPRCGMQFAAASIPMPAIDRNHIRKSLRTEIQASMAEIRPVRPRFGDCEGRHNSGV